MTGGTVPALEAGGGGVLPSRIAVMADRLQVARASRERDRLAKDFARLVDRLLEPWMYWDGWALHVGCRRCQNDHEAPCWGRSSCHDFLHDCGCSACAEHQRALVAQGGLR